MVALAPKSSETSPWDVLERFPKLHSRAREAETTPCTEAPMLKSRSRIEIWLLIYESCDGLESFTRDPIESDESLYEYCWSSPLCFLDPTGNHPFAIPVVVGGGVVVTAAEAAAATFGISVLACLVTPACLDLMRLKIRDAIDAMTGAAKRALELACRATRRAYKLLEGTCGGCIKGPAGHCIFNTWRCISSAKSLACWNAVIAGRTGYFLSGCDILIPTTVDHPAAIQQAVNAAENCAKSVENNCFGDIEV